ncbi:PLP-dependent transferase [Aspergillus homomorphus CBS 101889]|uniref:PLP-dependent transferase n=1 Tax=Aspergillus homomorphus (strain CBS 101889) TaxID=1450537 RepID=A0A395HUH8_ASPHC|nr:PLP-dependent transferase [Aspergillus homomorphus CBS 101889]RAL10488.1 PLP-dependent transferase [Aspergillus homomorphus CBS 101889]
MLACPDLKRTRKLADTYDFSMVVDETIAHAVKFYFLPFADVVISNLTKIFSGECNVMGGGAILNPEGRHYQGLKRAFDASHEDNHRARDVMFMGRNSRNFVVQIQRINENVKVICEILRAHPLVKEVYYRKYSPTRRMMVTAAPTGGYGGLLLFTFQQKEHAIPFFRSDRDCERPESRGQLPLDFALYMCFSHNLGSWIGWRRLECRQICCALALESRM